MGLCQNDFTPKWSCQNCKTECPRPMGDREKISLTLGSTFFWSASNGNSFEKLAVGNPLRLSFYH